jgi:hypothetical protein
MKALGFTPVKRHSEKTTAGAAKQAGIGVHILFLFHQKQPGESMSSVAQTLGLSS